VHEARRILLEQLRWRLGAFLLRHQGIVPWRRKQRSRPERETSEWRNSRVTTNKSSSGNSKVLQYEYCSEQYFEARFLKKIESDFNEIYISGKEPKKSLQVPVEEFIDLIPLS